MKRPIFAAFGAGLLAVTLVSVGLSATMNFEHASARYPGSMHIVSEHFNLLSFYKGYISQDSVYQTDDELTHVTAWYAGRYQIEPEHGMYTQGQCVRLARVDYYILIRPTVVVMLCSMTHGTQVFFNQTVYLQP